MTLNTFKCNRLTSLHFEGLNSRPKHATLTSISDNCYRLYVITAYVTQRYLT